MLSACNFGVITRSLKIGLEGSSPGHAVWWCQALWSIPVGLRCSKQLHSPQAVLAKPWKSTQNISTFTLNLFLCRWSCDFLPHSPADSEPVYSFPLCLNIWVIISCLPLSPLCSGWHELGAGWLAAEITFSRALLIPCWTLSRSSLRSRLQSWTIHCGWGLPTPGTAEMMHAVVWQIGDICDKLHSALCAPEWCLLFIDAIWHIKLSLDHFWDAYPNL